MRIVNLTEFLALPSNTLYSKYQPCVFGPLEIRLETCGEMDFFTSSIADAVECLSGEDYMEQLNSGKSLPMDLNHSGRDACFEPDQLFAVWEAADIQQLITALNHCLLCANS